MDVSAALQGRTRLAALLHQLEHGGQKRAKGPALDRRNRRTWRQLVLAVLVARSTRLLALGRVIAPQRRVHSVTAAAMALTYFLQRARVAVPTVSHGVLAEAVCQVDPKRLVTYRGKVLVLTRLSVVGTHLTVGKLGEAIGLDYPRHQRAWSHVWLR